MTRQNLFSDLWDGDNEEAGTRRRVFWRPDDARLGATLYELAPGTPESRIHMHYGAEEMFFVLSGRPAFRNQHGKETLAPETSSSARRDGPGCPHSAIRLTNPLRSWRSVPGASPTSSPIPKTDTRGWPLAIPTPSYWRREAIRIIARFEIPSSRPVRIASRGWFPDRGHHAGSDAVAGTPPSGRRSSAPRSRV